MSVDARASLGSRRWAAWSVALALACAVVYAPTAWFGFVWDDHDLVEPSAALGGLGGLVRTLGTDLYRAADPTQPPSAYYRPVAAATYWANAAVLGATPGGLHLGNVLLHAVAAALFVVLLARRLGPVAPRTAVLVAAAWWALHPEHVETVAWISARYDLLCAIAALGLLAWKPGGWGAAVGQGLVFLAGLWSKEGFVAMAVVVAVDDWSARRPWRAALPRWTSIATAIAGWVALRNLLDIPDIAPARANLVSNVLSTVGTYALRALAPLPLTTSHPFVTWPAPALLLVAVGIALSIAAAIRWRSLAVPLALFGAPLLPTAMACATFGSAAERYAYLPSLGLAWLLALGIVRARAAGAGLARVGTPAAAAALVALGLPSTVLRLADWRSDEALFTAAVAVDPDDWQANLSLSRVAISRGDLDGAAEHLVRAQRRNPSSAYVANALASVHARRGEGTLAVAQAQRAIRLEPRFAQAFYHLAAGLHETGDHAGERAALDSAVRLAPGWTEPLVIRAATRCELGTAAPACEAELEALARAPGTAPGALEALVEAALRRRDAAAARERLARLRTVANDHPALPALERAVARLEPASR